MVKKVGKYEIGKTIGEGTFGKVKLAVNTETGEKMAIKVSSAVLPVVPVVLSRYGRLQRLLKEDRLLQTQRQDNYRLIPKVVQQW